MQTTISQVDYKKHYTYADYFAINDDKRYEVMEGHIMMVPAPNTFCQRFGVKEYWLVFPEEKAIEIMTLENGIYRELCSAKEQGTVQSKLLHGFEVELKGVF